MDSLPKNIFLLTLMLLATTFGYLLTPTFKISEQGSKLVLETMIPTQFGKWHELTQKKSSNQTIFEFGEDKLKYSLKGTSGKKIFSTDYGSISDEDFDEFEEKNEWFRNVGILWVLIGVFQIANRLMESGSFSGSMWLTLGIICLITYRYKTTSYTIVDAETGRIFIIKDAQHSKILDEISV